MKNEHKSFLIGYVDSCVFDQCGSRLTLSFDGIRQNIVGVKKKLNQLFI